jgi:hypothetical protein
MTTRLSEPRQDRRVVDRLRRVAPWQPVLVAWLVSRVLSVFTLMVLGARDVPRPDITRLVMWDGGWYQLIATHGYGPPPIDGVWSVWPFFPLYPALVRGLHLVGSPYSFAQVVVANAALLIALAGVWRLSRRHVSARAASYAVWITALFPGGITFAMGYSDSLYLAGAVWAFVLLEERRPVAAGAAALVATAARPNGFVVVVSLVVAAIVQYRSAGPERRRAVVAVAAPSVVFLVVWMGVCWYHTGDPLVFLTAKSAWVEYTLAEAPTYLPAVLHVAMAALLAVPFVVRIRRQPVAWIVFVGLSLLPSLVLGVVGLGRYAVGCFPLAIAAGALLDRWDARVARLALAGSAAALVGWALLVTQSSYVP